MRKPWISILPSILLYCTLPVCIALFSTTSVNAQFGGVKLPKTSDVKKAIEKEVKEEKKAEPKEESKQPESKSAETKTPAATETTTQSPQERTRTRDKSVEANETGDVTSRKLYFILGKIYDKSGVHIDNLEFSEEVLAKLKNFDRKSYESSESARAAQPGYTDKNMAKDVSTILADYDAWLEREKVVDEWTKKYYGQAQQQQAPADKLKAYNKVITMCSIIQKVTPDNPTVAPKLAEVQKLIAIVEKSMGAATTSDFHKSHLNQMVFSGKPYKPGDEANGDIRNSFKAGEPIYATIYLGRKVRQATDSYAEQPIEIRVDGGLRGIGHVWVTTPMQENTYLQIAIIPGEDWLKENYKPYLENENTFYSGFLTSLVQELPIKHEMEVTFKFRASGAEKFKTKFSFDMGEGMEQLEALQKNLKNQSVNSRKLPEVAMKNPAYEKEMLDIAKKKFTQSTFYKADILNKEWRTITNKLTGAITARELTTAVYYKAFDGKCYWQYMWYQQDYTGAGKYASTMHQTGVGDAVEIPCDKAK